MFRASGAFAMFFFHMCSVLVLVFWVFALFCVWCRLGTLILGLAVGLEALLCYMLFGGV